MAGSRWVGMMMSSNGNIFRVTGPLWRESTSHRGQWHRALKFSLICAWTNGWANKRDTSDLRYHHADYDVTVVGRECSEEGYTCTIPCTQNSFCKIYSMIIMMMYLLLSFTDDKEIVHVYNWILYVWIWKWYASRTVQRYICKSDVDIHKEPYGTLKHSIHGATNDMHKLEQLEHPHSENTPHCSWLPILLIHIRSQVKTRQSQVLNLKNLLCQKLLFFNFAKTLHATHLLKLLDKMCKYEMDLASIFEVTEQTRTDTQTDGRCETSISPFQLHWS